MTTKKQFLEEIDNIGNEYDDEGHLINDVNWDLAILIARILVELIPEKKESKPKK
jgi:hypothetical protein